MRDDAFLKLVRDLRQAQRKLARGRCPVGWVEKCRDLEEKVDAVLATPPGGQTLFTLHEYDLERVE